MAKKKSSNIENLCTDEAPEICFEDNPKIKGKEVASFSFDDNSTSEDWLKLYKVDFEDINGKRFSIKFDIPIIKDNFMMLRGNRKTISNQLFLMPIIN